MTTTDHSDLFDRVRLSKLPVCQMMSIANDDDGLEDLARGGLAPALQELWDLAGLPKPFWQRPSTWYCAALSVALAGLASWLLI